MTPTETHNFYFESVSNSYNDEYSGIYYELLLYYN